LYACDVGFHYSYNSVGKLLLADLGDVTTEVRHFYGEQVSLSWF